jgi:hypothetical protein
MIPKTNQFAGKCLYCKGVVPAGEGILNGRSKSGKGWAIAHTHDCLAGEEHSTNEPPNDYGDWVTPTSDEDIDKDYHG